MKKTAILGIDLQYDFTDVGGALYVNGADKDIERIVAFIANNKQNIDYIALTLDSHQPIHIAHQCYWKNVHGNPPSLYTNIRYKDVVDGIWIPQYNKDRAEIYLKTLEINGGVCTIWPMHCILGSIGWTINQTLLDYLIGWSIETNHSYELFYKGYNQSTEHYSIFRAAVEWEDSPETHLNLQLLDILNRYNEVILVGEAADYCVASSLNDIVIERPELAKKIIVLTDCMSWITDENPMAVAIYENAKRNGVRFQISTEYSI